MLTDESPYAGGSALLLAQWSRGVAEMIGQLHKQGFETAMLRAVTRLVDFDFVMVFSYRGQEKPLALADTRPKQRKVIIGDYLNGLYLLDPFFQKTLTGTRSGCFRLQELAPDRFRQSEYYRAHYHLTQICEEVGFFFGLCEGAIGVVSLARWTTSPRLSRRDMALLRLIEPVIGAFSAAHWADAAESPAEPGWRLAESDQIATAYQRFGRKLLSERERQIVTLVLQGHSTRSIALRLDISPGTVKIHRKNIYRKLHISTQGELFAAFLSFIG